MMGQRILLLFFVAFAFTARPAYVRAAATVTVVPVADRALALLALTLASPNEQVLLFDPTHSEPFYSFLHDRNVAVQCLHQQRVPRTLATFLQTNDQAPCTGVESLLHWSLAKRPDAREAIAVSVDDYPWFLRAAAFAATMEISLLPLGADAGAALAAAPGERRFARIFVSPPAARWNRFLSALANELVSVDTPDALVEELLRRLPEPPRSLVIANPADVEGVFSPSSLSLIAPAFARIHRAPLFLTSGSTAKLVEAEVQEFIARHDLRPTHLILVGDELALRSHRIADPVLAAGGPEARGGGIEIRVELFSQIQHEQPQDFVVGRVVAEDVAVASVNLRRQLESHSVSPSDPVIFLVNADEIFPLGETISRTTIAELRNANVPVRAYFRKEVTPERILRSLEKTEFLVWEGHSRDLTLEERGGIAAAHAPEIVFLQGCYTLDRSDPFILMEKGTLAIIASSAAIYSAPGSAFARSLFDALIHDGADLGTAVRNARNFLLALARLKRERGHTDWVKTYRAALAFALWGDPTLRPRIQPTPSRLPPARWSLAEDSLSLDIPPQTLPEVVIHEYSARPVPRAMLGGLLLKHSGGKRRLKELYYYSTVLSGENTVVCPAEHGWDVISLYAPLSRTLTVLARPDWTEIESKKPYGRFTFRLRRAGEACPGASRAAPPGLALEAPRGSD